MPPRPPPKPPTLTLLCSVAAAAAVWVSIATDQLARGLVGSVLGVPFLGLEIAAGRRYTVGALQGPVGSLGPGGFAVMVLAGSACILVMAMGLFALVRAMQVRGWLRGFALAWIVVALLWLPAALASATLPAGGGPVHELYARLGDPLAGRWTALALALLLLAIASRTIGARAVAVGRSWMRADATEFRRRLVRVTAGWPGMVALAALAYGAGWAPTLWAGVFLAAVMVALQMQTR
jgi:hypothetical protein